MGLLDKVKNLFTEEIEEELPIKKEVKHIEIPNPRKEIIKEELIEEPVVEVKKEIISDSAALNREEKFKFPVYFDDKDFEDLPKKEEPKKVEIKKEEPKVEPYKASKMVEEKKNFKPSPIISPVYGILDKNYKKDDISPKRERPVRHYQKEEKLTVDDIRKKAYGTLEDELEDTLYGVEPVVFTQEEVKEPEIDIFKELETQEQTRQTRSKNLLVEEKEEAVDLTRELERQKQKIEEINEFIKQNTVEKEVEEDIFEEATPLAEETKVFSMPQVEEEKDIFDEVKEVEEIKEEEQLDNGDLFNLIDSMYEKREEE